MKKLLLLFSVFAVLISRAQTVSVTFQVDMSDETVINNDVQVVIKNPWIWTPLVNQGDGIWEATVNLDPNATYPYTFVNGGQDNWDGEERIEGDCNFGSETAPERHVEVGNEDIVLDLVAFGGCESLFTGIEDFAYQYGMYPNPCSENLTINSLQSPIKTIDVFNLDGKILYSERVENLMTTMFDMTGFKAGAYIVVVNRGEISGNASVVVKK